MGVYVHIWPYVCHNYSSCHKVGGVTYQLKVVTTLETFSKYVKMESCTLVSV